MTTILDNATIEQMQQSAQDKANREATLNKLVGVGRSGDFVLTSQGTAAEQGFRNVSSIWYPKTQSFDYGMEQIERGIASREDIETSLDAVSAVIDEHNRFAFAFADGREFLPNKHAIRQFAVKLDIPITTVNHLTETWAGDIEASYLLRNTFNHGLKRHNAEQNTDERDKFIFRTYRPDGHTAEQSGALRAVLTDSFAPVDNRWFLELLSTLIPDGRLSHWKGDADEICGNILIPDSIRQESDSDYGGMIAIGNSEIGTGRISSTPSVFRAICMNGNIWDEMVGNSLDKVHRGKIDLQLLAKRITLNVNEQIPLLSTIIDKVLATRSDEFGIGGVKVPQVYAALRDTFKLSTAQAKGAAEQWAENESQDRNLFGIVNGLTRQSQLEDNAQWRAIDTLAGKLSAYDSATWSNFLSRASTYSEKQVCEALGLAMAS